MLEFLPKDVREGLEAARKKDLKRRSRLRVQVGDAVYPILRFWDDGFALDADLSPGKLPNLPVPDHGLGDRERRTCLRFQAGDGGQGSRGAGLLAR